jgi:uncharacterized protein (TIGR03790 family)
MHVHFGLLIALGAAGTAAIPPGGLDPNHIGLVFNKNSQQSGELALFYADRRGIPKRQMIALDVALAEQMPRERYEPDVAEPIRKWLIERDMADRIACLVTFYDVPIRVDRQSPTPEMRQALRRARRYWDTALKEYEEVLVQANQIVRPTKVPTTTTSGPRPEKKVAGMAKQFRTTVVQAIKRATRLREPSAVRDVNRQILSCMERAHGVSGVVAHLRQSNQGDAHLGEVQLEKLQRAVRQGTAQLRAMLGEGMLSPRREDAYRLIRRIAGVIGLLGQLERDINELKGLETNAALDSELSLLWARPASLYRWRVNTLNVRLRSDQAVRASRHATEFERPAVMVARLDGPNPSTVRRIIEDAFATEKVGLKGHAYFDARGLSGSNRPGSYGSYDEDVRALAELMRTKTSIPTVLDNRKELFGPGACPDTAIYCGWYSLGKYQDAFDFVRGAVAFHIASVEAVSLRRSKRQYWCRRLLEDGVAATLGPVAEPYLMAFPKPREFFGLLLTGQYSLVECYYYTKPYASWMMLLIGDPLYRPFAANPQLKVEDVLTDSLLPIKPIPTSQPAGSASTQPAGP